MAQEHEEVDVDLPEVDALISARELLSDTGRLHSICAEAVAYGVAYGPGATCKRPLLSGEKLEGATGPSVETGAIFSSADWGSSLVADDGDQSRPARESPGGAATAVERQPIAATGALQRLKSVEDLREALTFFSKHSSQLGDLGIGPDDADDLWCGDCDASNLYFLIREILEQVVALVDENEWAEAVAGLQAAAATKEDGKNDGNNDGGEMEQADAPAMLA